MKKLLITKLLKKYQPSLVVIFGSYGRFETGSMLEHVLASDKNTIFASVNDVFKGIESSIGGIFGLLKAWIAKGKFPQIIILETSSSSNVVYQYIKSILGLDVAIVVTAGDIPSFAEVFAGSERGVKSIMREASSAQKVIAVTDDETIRDALSEIKPQAITVGFDEHSDVSVKDLKNVLRFGDSISGGTQLKIEYDGSFMPLYLQNTYGKKNIYAACCALLAASHYNINFINAAEKLAKMDPYQGSMALGLGIKNSALISHFHEVTPFSAREIIEMAGNMHSSGMARRVVLILGDVLLHEEGEAESFHRALGELASKNSSLLFSAGERTVFTQEEAQKYGMLKSSISRHKTMQEAAINAKKQIKERDLIVVLGSKEIDPKQAVEELKLR